MNINAPAAHQLEFLKGHLAPNRASRIAFRIYMVECPELFPWATSQSPRSAATRCPPDLPRRDAALVGMIDKDVEITRRVAEHSQQQRNLSAMMNTMIGRVLHQFSQGH
jgi:hypothetical protein